MTAVHLLRIDPARNMRRFYRLDLQPDLFGGVALVKEWGRVGRAGQVRSECFADPAAARTTLEKQQRAKARRGYTINAES
jgi:predicted DNA-binding WGR domain protein